MRSPHKCSFIATAPMTCQPEIGSCTRSLRLSAAASEGFRSTRLFALSLYTQRVTSLSDACGLDGGRLDFGKSSPKVPLNRIYPSARPAPCDVGSLPAICGIGEFLLPEGTSGDADTARQFPTCVNEALSPPPPALGPDERVRSVASAQARETSALR
jgi:hypothetical protein